MSRCAGKTSSNQQLGTKVYMKLVMVMELEYIGSKIYKTKKLVPLVVISRLKLLLQSNDQITVELNDNGVRVHRVRNIQN
jgi:hypothetical protein